MMISASCESVNSPLCFAPVASVLNLRQEAFSQVVRQYRLRNYDNELKDRKLAFRNAVERGGSVLMSLLGSTLVSLD